MSPIKPTKKRSQYTPIKVDGRTLRGSRAGGAPNECTTAVRLMLPHSVLAQSHRLLQTPKQGKGLGPEDHIHASARGIVLRVVPRFKGSQDHSAHNEQFKFAAVQLVDGVLFRLDPGGLCGVLISILC